MEHQYLIIMAGGIGSRFYPASRQSKPKQFHDILGTGKTLIRQTFERFSGICLPENVFVVTNREYAQLVAEQLPELSEGQILLEPTMRNTAPCIAYATYKIAQRDPQANMVVSPADHLVLQEDRFQACVTTALEFSARENALVTIGIQPSFPHTGYGYIKRSEERNGALFRVGRFAEKPNRATAERFLAEGGYLWNSGIFVWSAAAIRQAFRQHLPEVHRAFSGLEDAYFTPEEARRIPPVYESCPSVSIDYGVMEKSEKIYVLPADFGWSDLGTWKSLYDVSEKDENENVMQGRVLAYGVSGSVVKSGDPDKLMIISGLKDFIVAEYEGVLLVCPKDEEQRIKQFLADAKASFPDGRYS